MKFKILIFISYFLFVSLISAQNNKATISGVVSDSLRTPLANVTLILKPTEKKGTTKYAITNNLGYYKIDIIKGLRYDLQVSHLAYKTMKREISSLKDVINYDISLSSKNEDLDEVVINYKYEPLKKSKDTITYKVNAFTNGNEFKMKDVLEKLPGIKTEDNLIKVQGKPVTKLLVEGKPFFDGSTKLAIENIPADVMDKIEIISDYKESELLRNLADNEDLALNVILKKDKKDFTFGDAEAGFGFDNFYSLHTALFKYNPESNISFIGDLNNFNKSSLSLRDLSRLVGGSSNLFKRSSLSSNLLNFAASNRERFKSTTRFSALNFQHEFSDKLTFSGYAIYSNNDIDNKSFSLRKYLTSNPITETRNNLSTTNNEALILNFKLDYAPNSNQKWRYNANYLHNSSGFKKESLSNVENASQFFTSIDGKNNSFSQNLEGYFKLSNKHTMGVALHHNLTYSSSKDNWSSNALFLEDFIPLTRTDNYKVNQNNRIYTQKLNLIVKDYWLTSRYFHLFYNAGINYKESNISNDITQIVSENTLLNFSDLGNNNHLRLTDLNVGLGIKTKLNKLECILEAKPHIFKFNRAEINSSTLFIEPKLSINYKIHHDINLDFDYSYSNRFLSNLSYIKNLKITGFNSAIQGNPSLFDERSHNFSLYYSNYKTIDSYFLDLSLDYSINNPVKNNSITQRGINQLNTPVILNIPEESLNFNANIGILFNKSSLEFSTDLDWLKVNQVINKKINSINSFEYMLSSKWILKLTNKTQISTQFKHLGYLVNAEENSRSTENIFSLNFDSRLLKNFIFKTNLSAHFVNDFSNNNQNYVLQDLYLGYMKRSSKFSYSLNFRNMYNNSVTIRNTFNNNLLISNQVFTLPRTFLFELKYKF